MCDSAESSSTQLSNVLNILIGKEDSIKSTRMHATKAKLSTKYFTIYLIGSWCDGLFLKGHDLDVMYVHKNLTVQDNLFGDVTDVKLPSSYLTARCSPSTSAYRCIEMHVKLNHVLNSTSRVLIALCDSVIYYKNTLLVSSSLFLQHNSRVEGGDMVGPSQMNRLNIEGDNDNVQAFHCKEFPLVANEWIHRKRKYSWPSPRIIQLVKEVGYHLVPIGDYNSTMHQFQWRTSFALHECVLVRTFSHVQMQVYAFMKMIKSEVLSGYRSQQTGEALITSFHIKTLIFWTIECVPNYIWCEENLLLCIQICLRYLKQFVKSNFMPHYFMPQCNLFKKHISKDHHGIINGLSNCIKNPLTVIDAVFRGIGREEMNMLHVLHTCSDLKLYTNVDNGHSLYNPMTVTHTLLTTVHRMKGCEWFLTYGLLLISMLNFKQLIGNLPSDGVKCAYKQYRKVKQISMRYTHLDISMGWLLLSSYLYQTHNYEKCWKIINRKVILPITELPHVVYCERVRNEQHLCYTLTGECSGMSIPQLYKHLACCRFTIHVSLLPFELTIEANQHVELVEIYSLHISPLPYAYFLSFLCAYHLRDVSLQFKFLHLLQSMLTDEHFGVIGVFDEHYSFTLNMIGICCELMGEVLIAAFYYRLSAYGPLPTFTRAANIRLQLLMIHYNIYIVRKGVVQFIPHDKT